MKNGRVFMAKKIFAIGMVKNEVDIIESFVRYNINIFDGMIILDNGSTDHTLEILKKLKGEGLPLFILEDADRKYEQNIKMNKLLEIAVDEFQADIIVPLDADEFIIASTRGNPREILEMIEPDSFHLVMWKTYIPVFGKNENKIFIPSKVTMARDDSLEKFYKVILPKDLYNNYNVKLTFGNHDLKYDPKFNKLIKRVINPELRIAHFPIRSKDQVISKIVVGWIYSLYRSDRTERQGFHWKIFFDKIKESEELTNKDVTDLAKQFALKNGEKMLYPQKNPTGIDLKDDPIDLTFCKNIDIKYDKCKVKPISNILESFEWISMDFSSTLRKSVIEKKYLEDKIKCYKNSTSWKITAPLRKINNCLINLFK